MMKGARISWALSILAVTAGFVASAILLVDYVRRAPVFCDEHGGCGAVRLTRFAYIAGIPTPALGLAGFLLLGVLALSAHAHARTAFAIVATAEALFAITLIGVQISIHSFCRFCMITDGAAIALMLLAWHRRIGAWDPPAGWVRHAPWALFAAAAITPIAIGFTKKLPPPDDATLPDVIARELEAGPPGKVTIVDFVDFECPWCRKVNTSLGPLLEAHRAQVHLVRKQMPLSMHPHAMTAARAACCGESMGKGDEMAEALFSAPVQSLTPEGCAKIAQSLGLDAASFAQCVDDPKTAARIEADRAEFQAAHGHGLPTLWIGRDVIKGAAPAAEYERVLNLAIAHISS